MRILFVASEGLPFSKTGGLADVIEALPKALVEAGHEVAVFLPRYRGNPANETVVTSLSVPMGLALRFPSITLSRAHNVDYFFLNDPPYFDREQLYGLGGRDYPDNGVRFGEFCRAAAEFAKIVWTPEVIHCHDWQSGLLPVMMKTIYRDDPQLRGLPVVFTIHNMGYQGLFPRELLAQAGLPDALFRMDALEFYGKVNCLKAGLLFSDYLTTVSRKYALEIQTAEYGCGLEGVVRRRAERLTGILNGVDYSVWNPATDKLIAEKYSARNLEGKKACKKDLLAEFGLPDDNPTRPLIGIVSRFADQKGFDLLEEVADEILREDLEMVALGAGDGKHEKMFRDLAKRYPAKLAVKIAYDNSLSHKVEAGSDMFLMPSRYEPSGLNQMYSLRYGTVPVVRATGGLDDTIEPFVMKGDARSISGTGFKFQPYTGEALLRSLREALGVFAQKTAWRRVQLNGMAKDFSWRVSAGEYVRLYQAAVRGRIRSAPVSSN